MPTTAIAVREDQLVPLADVRAMVARLPRGRLHEISSVYGHDAFLKEAEQLRALFMCALRSGYMSQKPDPITQAVRAGLESDRGDGRGGASDPSHIDVRISRHSAKSAPTITRAPAIRPATCLAQALSELEGGAGAVVTATGMAAMTLIGYLLPANARIVAPHDCYGGTYRLFDAWRRRGELRRDFVNFGDETALRAALEEPTAMVWIETPSNPLLRITDIERVAALGRAARRTGGGRQYLSITLVAAAARPRSGPRRSLDDEVPERPQRCGGRGGDRRALQSCTSSSYGGRTAWA